MLKVPRSEPLNDVGNAPIQDNNPTTIDNSMPPMGMEDNMDEFGASDDNEMDESDPKKHIQQLTGKLSQELRLFNQNEDDNGELSKYVAGMIIPQATKNLSSQDKENIIKKINSSSDSDDDENLTNNNLESDDIGEKMDTANESKQYLNYYIDEMIDSLIKTHKKEKKIPKNQMMNNPFESNR